MNKLNTMLDEILLDKNTNLLPTNLKAGITCLGVTGTNPALSNIFCQLDEPTSKTGLWLKLDKQYPGKVDVYKNAYNSLEISSVVSSNIAYTIASVGTSIYMFGASSVGLSSARAYKYDTLTNIYTELSRPPVTFASNTGSISIGDKIYLFGGSYGTSDKAYVYDTVTDTYTRLGTTPKTFVGILTAVLPTDNDNIYIFGNWQGNFGYKYNITSKKYTALASPTVDIGCDGTCVIDNDIYLIGSSGSSAGKRVLKYNTLSNTYTSMTNLSRYAMSAKIVQKNNYAYVIGGVNYTNNIIQYNLLTGESLELEMPYEASFSSSVTQIGNMVYFISAVDSVKYMQIINLDYIPYPYLYDCIVIKQDLDNTYNTELYIGDLKLSVNFSDFWYCESHVLLDGYEKYYGDGEQWLLINNTNS